MSWLDWKSHNTRFDPAIVMALALGLAAATFLATAM
jgi:hypothetical protein